MPVNYLHRSYEATKSKWQRCRDTYNGGDDVRKRGAEYLPVLEGHIGLPNQAALYSAYSMRALFYPAVSRTVLGLTGIVFDKPPSLDEVPEARREMFNDLTLSGISLMGYALQLCTEDLIVGRAGTLVDYPSDVLSTSRPYAVMYDAESIINWRAVRISGKDVLTLVVLKEEVEQFDDVKDRFVPKVLQQYRVLELVNGVYTVTIYVEDPNKRGTFLEGTPSTPLRLGRTLSFIPFTFLGTVSLDSNIEHPPLIDLADVVLSHYRTSADHEHGAHYTALPTAWISGGVTNADKDKPIGLGPGNVLVLPQGAQAGMLEFSGSGLKSLADLKQEKVQQMITLGARMLETQKNVQEAAKAIKLRHSGERSALSVMADTIGQHLSQVVRWCLYWNGLEETAANKALVTLNPDVMDELSSEDIKALVTTWQAGAISKKTLYANLEWGEWTRPGVTFDEEEKDIKSEGGTGELDLLQPPLLDDDDE